MIVYQKRIKHVHEMQKSKTTLVIEKDYNLIDVKYGNFEIYCIRWNEG